jgi:type IV pilus biogenesis protein CpaD/CtpE
MTADRAPRLIGILSLALGLGCAGCAAIDPYQRAGMWQPMGAVQGNLAAMVADPDDLVAGHGDGQAAHYQTTAAVDRLWADQTKPLLNSQSQGSGSPAATPQSSPPAAGSGGN